MGKSKGGGKKPNVFKVAGAKSLKVKSKAKPVTGNLRKINEIVRKNVGRIDKTFVHLQSDLIQKKKENLNAKPNQKKKMIDEKELEKEKQKTLDKLSSMQF